MEFKVLQLKKIDNYAFMSYEYAQKHNFSLDDYQEVYSGEINANDFHDIFDLLEYIFTRFNIDTPNDFDGHSLSVSDVIKLDDNYYYVDVVSFQLIR